VKNPFAQAHGRGYKAAVFQRDRTNAEVVPLKALPYRSEPVEMFEPYAANTETRRTITATD
jgi:hypothetical protein